MMPQHWTTAVVDTALPGGRAVAWLKGLGLPVLLEQGIGYLDSEPVYLIEFDGPVSIERGQWQGLRAFMLQAAFEHYRLLAYAAQISTWAREHRFCGSCGRAMNQVPNERAMQCERCHLRNYPRISPSMIVLITRGDHVLLARSPRFVSGVYSTLAGFVEPGETAEECVAREVREEVSLEVRDIRYMGSQCWPFPHSMMLGFHAEYAGGDIIPQADEIEDAQWFHINALPLLPAPRSIARYLIDLYVARRSGLPEPVLPG
jgi:NAD+ diphosphatase